MDERQASIVFQSSLKIALDIERHNSDVRRHLLPGDADPIKALELLKVDPKDVVELALKFARLAMDPRAAMKRQEDKDKGDK